MTPYCRSIRIVKETSFGSLGADGLPDRSIFDEGGDSVVFDVEQASIVVFGDAPQAEVSTVKNAFWRDAPEPETIRDGEGNLVRRRKGQLTLECILRDTGTADPETIAMMWALGSSLTPLYPTNRTATITTEVGSGQAGVADATAEADCPTGGLIAYMPADLSEPAAFTQVVSKSSAEGTTTLGLSPLLPKATLEANDVVRTCVSFASLPGRDPAESVAYRLDGDGWRQYAWGCRMASLAASGDGQSRIKRATLTMESALLQAAHDEVTRAEAIDKRPSRPAGSVPLHALGACVTVSDPIESAGSPPRVGGRVDLPVDAWSYTITTELAPINNRSGIIAMADLQVSRAMLDMELTLSEPVAAVADDYLYRRHRSLQASWGPAPGFGIVIPAAHQANDGSDSRDLGGNLVRQVLSYREGPPLDVTPTEDEAEADPPFHLSDAAFVIAFGLTPAP